MEQKIVDQYLYAFKELLSKHEHDVQHLSPEKKQRYFALKKQVLRSQQAFRDNVDKEATLNKVSNQYEFLSPYWNS